jgi:hypothetical protein
MNFAMKSRIKSLLALSLIAGVAHAETGKIRICRDPGIIGDGSQELRHPGGLSL